jgi:hypothetical protein
MENNIREVLENCEKSLLLSDSDRLSHGWGSEDESWIHSYVFCSCVDGAQYLLHRCLYSFQWDEGRNEKTYISLYKCQWEMPTENEGVLDSEQVFTLLGQIRKLTKGDDEPIIRLEYDYNYRNRPLELRLDDFISKSSKIKRIYDPKKESWYQCRKFALVS